MSEKVGPKPVRLGLGGTVKNRSVLLSREVQTIIDLCCRWGGGGVKI